MDAKEMLRQYATGQRSFRTQDLRNLVLTHANLNDADFTGSNLSGSDLSYANLTNANLNWTTLKGANLSGAYLKGAKMPDGRLHNDFLESANYFGNQLTFCLQKQCEANIMAKERKGNKEAKKPKENSNKTKKQKKDPKRYDGIMQIDLAIKNRSMKASLNLYCQELAIANQLMTTAKTD